MTITLNGDTGITTPTYGGAVTAEYTVPVTGFKNRIINGAMMIDQRNVGASITPTDTQYTVDRWIARLTQSSKFSVQQNAGSVTPPVGFINYLGVTSLSAYSVVASDFFSVNQPIEGLNMADFAWGTANAKTVTLSFWVRSSLTGTFAGAIRNNAADYSYIFSYSISSANTWEQKSVTIAGPTSGTWPTNNGRSAIVEFNLGTGSDRNGTVNSWNASNVWSFSGATSVVGTNGATIQFTGVQLEKGSTSTSFDYRPYTTELQLCQRYYEKSYDTGTAIGTATQVGAAIFGVYQTTNGYYYASARYKVEKRSAPTITTYSTVGTVTQACNGDNADLGANSAATTSLGTSAFGIYNNRGSNISPVGNCMMLHYTASAEL